MTYRIAIVGAGESPEDPDSDGFAMAYRHAAGYRRLDDCEIVACADIVPENARQFADEFDVDGVYEDYERMLAETDPDIVSVTVPPAVHAEIVTGCADHGGMDAIHCEKPMATTWADCEEMARACEDADVELTINHQRRVGPTYERAKELLDDGTIGDLQRVECSAMNLFDAGTHVFDLAGMFTDQATPDWVLANVDYREENRWFGAHNENQAIAQWRYENGVHGLASTGEGSDAVGCYVRLIGTEGRIEIGVDDGPPLRVRHGRTLGWSRIDTGENMWGDTLHPTWKAAVAKVSRALPGFPDEPFPQPSHVERAIESVVDAVRRDGVSPLSAKNALQSTELVFASWESARRRGRVDLPLDIEDNPLEAMVEAGMLPVGRDDADGDGDIKQPLGSRTDDD
ncbi:Gfo/Idh/MocA family protein [Halorientalis marina]|uniref:Gfo/Idh/MocA family protein n=1 Tax=Halorientalis marina TaxID=2931976 RepID=UPI001FF41372|nr:Gfo/Idh/MocA family oxidoreductase [Halorientalis marina]